MKNFKNSDPEHSKNSGMYKRPQSIKTIKEVLEVKSLQLSWLVDNLIPSGQLTALVAPSDVGKSILCRQLAVSTVLKDDSFLGLKLTTKGRQVIYVSTEDMDYEWKEKMQKYPLTKPELEKVSDKMLLITNFGGSGIDLCKLLEQEVQNNPTELIVIDVLTDIFTGELNSSVAIRTFLKPFKQLAALHDTAILFVHHVSKKGEQTGQHHKQNVLGSQAIEATMRSVLELRKDPDSSDHRILKITKGNYVPENVKKQSLKLFLTDKLVYERRFGGSSSVEKEEITKRVFELTKLGNSSRTISELLATEGIKLGKTAINDLVRNYKGSFMDKQNDKPAVQ